MIPATAFLLTFTTFIRIMRVLLLSSSYAGGYADMSGQEAAHLLHGDAVEGHIDAGRNHRALSSIIRSISLGVTTRGPIFSLTTLPTSSTKSCPSLAAPISSSRSVTASWEIVEACTTVGTPIAITLTPRLSRLISMRRLAQPAARPDARIGELDGVLSSPWSGRPAHQWQ